jgi:hypothetical protein
LNGVIYLFSADIIIISPITIFSEMNKAISGFTFFTGAYGGQAWF